MELKLYTGIVTSINDIDKKGKVQVRILPDLEGVDEELLPWCIPFISNTSIKTSSNNVPKEGTTVWVLIDDFWKRFYYLTNRYFENIFDYDKVKNIIENTKVSDISTEYKDIDFNLYEDGTLEFHNNKDSSSGIIYSDGNYFIKNSKGKFVINSVSDMEISIKGAISIESTTNDKIKVGNNTNNTLGSLVSDFYSNMADLCTKLSTLTTIGSPSTQTINPTLSTDLIALSTTLNTEKTKWEGVFE